MKKIVMLITLSGLIGISANGCKHFWFSQSQQNAQFLRNDPTKVIVNFGRLKDNRIVVYTSISNDDFSANTSYRDSVYKGCGFFDKTEIIDLDNGTYHSSKPSHIEKYKEFLEKNKGF